MIKCTKKVLSKREKKAKIHSERRSEHFIIDYTLKLVCNITAIYNGWTIHEYKRIVKTLQIYNEIQANKSRAVSYLTTFFSLKRQNKIIINDIITKKEVCVGP